MSFRIEETFRLQAPPDRVWAYVTDPRQVVTCLPGAELTSVESETTFLGKVKVKVGPVVAAYTGRVTITERDEAARVVRLVGEGRESAGAGSARMTMTSALAALPDGGTEVRVEADLDVVGRLAQFGRGMIESVNELMFRQFTDCLRATLELPAAPEPATPAVEPSPVPAPPATDPAPAPDPPAPRGGAAPAGMVVEARTAPVVGAYAPPARAASLPAPPVAAVPAQPVRLLPVLFRALREAVARWLRRLRGAG